MRVLNILCSGGAGGIESLCRSISMSKCNYENYWLFIYEGGIIADAMKEYTNNIIILNEKRNIVKIVLLIRNYCKTNKIDIVVFHHSGLHNDILCVLSRILLLKTKFVRHQHICYSTNNTFKERLFDFVMKIEFKLSNLIIFVSNASKKSYENRFKLEKCNKAVVYNGISDEFYNKNTIKEKEKVFTYVGRLEPEKGVIVLLDAFRMFYKKNTDYKLRYIGDGSARFKLEKLVKKYHLENNVEILGKRLDVIKWLDVSKFFVYPSICEESFGISVVEAMARGSIPITFKKGGLPEIIKDSYNGFIVEDMSANSLCKKFLEVTSCDNYKNLVKNAFETSKNFTIENTINSLEKYYNNLL